uniref:Uncharacterized protein n=1 Tax=Magallana gigas TaxID=29159 RepID=K1RCR7_MAGGI
MFGYQDNFVNRFWSIIKLHAGCPGDIGWLTGSFEPPGGCLFDLTNGSFPRCFPLVQAGTGQIIPSSGNSSPSSSRNCISFSETSRSKTLYWLDRSTIKSSMTNGRDIKSHIVTKGAMKTIAYKDFFGWINKNEIYFARSISENADIVLNTVQNAKDISVFDSTLQEDRRGNKYYLQLICVLALPRSGKFYIPFSHQRSCFASE